MKKFKNNIEKRYAREIKRALRLKEGREFDKALKIILRSYNYYKNRNKLTLAYELLLIMVDCYMDDEKYSKAINPLIEIYNYSDKVHNYPLKAASTQRLGIANIHLGNNEESYKFFLEAYKLFKQLNDLKNQVIVLINIGLYHHKIKGNLEEAIKIFHKAEKLNLNNNLFVKMANIYQNLASLYIKLNDFTNFKENYEKAISYFEKEENPESIATFMINIISFLKQTGNLENDEEILTQNLEYCDKFNLKGCKITTLNNLGKRMFQKFDFDKALEYMKQALKVCEEHDLIHDKGSVLSGLALVYHRKENHSKAIEYLMKSLEIAKQFNDWELIIDNYMILGGIIKNIPFCLQRFNFKRSLSS